jgi:hypothetical protein
MSNEIFKDFDIELYKLINTDLLFNNDSDYYNHYSFHGKEEKRIKSYNDFCSIYPHINILEYQQLNYDLKLYSKNQVIAHYHNCGKNENRILSIKDFNDRYPDFNIKIYKFFNSDIEKFKEIDILAHYNLHGVNEERISSIKDFNINNPLFDLEFYKNMYDKNKLSDEEIIYDYYKNIVIIDKINTYLSKNNIKLFNNSVIYQVSNIDLFYKFYPDFDINLYKTYLKKMNKNNINYSDIELFCYFFKSSEYYISDFKDVLNKLFITKKITLKDINNSSVYSLNTFYKNYPSFNYYKYFKYFNRNSIQQDYIDENISELNTIISAYENIENLNKIFFTEDDLIEDSNEISEYLLKYQEIILKNKEETKKETKKETKLKVDSDIDQNILKQIKDLGLKNKLNDIIIYTNKELNLNNTEVTSQFYLASLLDKKGYRVRIYNNIEYKKNDIFNNYYINDLDINNSIVIYCNKIGKSPINSKYSINWIFKNNLNLSNGKDNLIYYFDNINITENKKYLSLFYLNPNIKNKYGNSFRKGFCYINNLNKESSSHMKLFHPSNSIEIKNENTIDEYIEIFNKNVFFISYEPTSFLPFIAILCGCICIIHPVENMTKKEWLETTFISSYIKNRNIDHMCGIAYGISDLDYAKNTINSSKDQWNDIIQYNIQTSLIPFLNDINKL